MVEVGERVRVVLDPCETEIVGVVETKNNGLYQVRIEQQRGFRCVANRRTKKDNGLVEVNENEIIEVLRKREMAG